MATDTTKKVTNEKESLYSAINTGVVGASHAIEVGNRRQGVGLVSGRLQDGKLGKEVSDLLRSDLSETYGSAENSYAAAEAAKTQKKVSDQHNQQSDSGFWARLKGGLKTIFNPLTIAGAAVAAGGGFLAAISGNVFGAGALAFSTAGLGPLAPFGVLGLAAVAFGVGGAMMIGGAINQRVKESRASKARAQQNAAQNMELQGKELENSPVLQMERAEQKALENRMSIAQDYKKSLGAADAYLRDYLVSKNVPKEDLDKLTTTNQLVDEVQKQISGDPVGAAEALQKASVQQDVAKAEFSERMKLEAGSLVSKINQIKQNVEETKLTDDEKEQSAQKSKQESVKKLANSRVNAIENGNSLVASVIAKMQSQKLIAAAEVARENAPGREAFRKAEEVREAAAAKPSAGDGATLDAAAAAGVGSHVAAVTADRQTAAELAGRG